MLSRCLALAALLAAAAALAPGAAASPTSDAESIGRDFSNGDIVSCRFTRKQLENALAQISADAEVYAQSAALRAEINREIRRWTSGRCKNRKVELKIVAIKPQGDAATESVTIKNVTRKTVNLRRYALRDAADHTIRFDNLKLGRGRKLTVLTGCKAGKSKAFLGGSRFHACRATQFWDDAGDVVELVTPQGGLLSARSYGTPPAT